jgi:hypothetical protein
MSAIALSGIAFVCIAGGVLLGMFLRNTLSGPANAVVYCKTEGVPKGCVARPVVAAPVVAAPVAGPVVYCKTRGVPKGCVMR